jgi:quinol monooxygenase YgiN
MPEVVVVAELHARPGKEDGARDVLEGLLAPTHAEPGCILYAMHQGVDDPARFAFVERWASREELEAHLGSPHLTAFMGRVDELFTEPPDILVLESRPGGEASKGSLGDAAG